tara:strand:+ start:7410 stop:7553 length:144 start_codon:yes stop_codon:yes gene_type:complete
MSKKQRPRHILIPVKGKLLRNILIILLDFVLNITSLKLETNTPFTIA